MSVARVMMRLFIHFFIFGLAYSYSKEETNIFCIEVGYFKGAAVDNLLFILPPPMFQNDRAMEPVFLAVTGCRQCQSPH